MDLFISFFSELSWFLIIPAIISLLVITRTSSSSSTKPRNLPPGPKKIPILGNLHQLGKLPHRSLYDLAKIHGPLMHLQLGQTPALVVSSPEMASLILKEHDLSFCSRPPVPAMQKYAYGGLDIAAAAYSDQWRQLRKIATQKLFTLKRVQSFQSIREAEVATLIKTISLSSSQGAEVNLSELFVSVTNNITGQELFSRRFSDDGLCNKSENYEYLLEMTELLGGFSIGDVFPSLRWVDVITGLTGRLDRNFTAVDKLLDEQIAEHCDPKRSSSHDDFLDVLLQLQHDSDLDFTLTKDHIKGVLMDVFLGGSDSSTSTLGWAMVHLIKDPRVMKKAQDEVRGVVGKQGTSVKESDLDNLPYLKLIVNEILRMHPPTALLVPRECREACKVNGYDIALKTRILVNIWAIGRDPRYWKEPEVFMPERFENNPVNYKGQCFEYIPFGSGRRICPGMQLGLVTVSIILANVLYHFDWKPPVGMEAKDIDMTEITTIAPKISGLQEALPKAIGLLPFDGGVAGCHRSVHEQLTWGMKTELKTEVLHNLKEIGSAIYFMGLLDIVLREIDTTQFIQTAPWLGFVPASDGQAKQVHGAEGSPIVHLFRTATATIVSNPTCPNPSSFLTMSKQAEAAELLYKTNLKTGSVLEYALAFTSAALDKHYSKWSANPKTGFIDITTSKDFYRIFSGLQFEYLEETVLDQSKNHDVLGDSVAWAGCTIMYLLGQQLHFELFDFSYQFLNVAEVESASLVQHISAKSSSFSQGYENLLEAMRKARRLNNHVFSMLRARCPLEDKVACAIKQSGAPIPRIRFVNTVSAFETLPQKGA